MIRGDLSMRLRLVLHVLIAFAIGFSLLAFGVIVTTVSCDIWLTTDEYTLIPAAVGVAGGLVVTLAGAFCVVYSLRCLRDLFSTGRMITGRVAGRRVAVTREVMGLPVHDVKAVYYLTVGSEEFEIPQNQYLNVAEGQEVTLTYLPNTRTVENVTRVRPVWITTTVISLAQAIRDEQAYDRLPILADAMEEAGCTDADLLKQCRMVIANEECQALIETITQEIVAAKGVTTPDE
ncbi:hypothetical protein AYO40_00475 [Planctomycetaceae bacterium SCGC AG-212-D15]|nr:hypothetical protein AYO40_00475 [Planctomycetaceae bacterium SCGC AG-212-D15]